MVLEIEYSHYQLTPKKQLNAKSVSITPREGALLRINDGYADLHPWPEFGDAPLEIQLRHLSEGVISPLLSRSLFYAEIDRRFRLTGLSAFADLSIPQSHTLLTDINELPTSAAQKSQSTFKIKIGRDLQLESDLINQTTTQSEAILRLDANAALSIDQCRLFWLSLTSKAKKQIEFIEDPTPYDDASWKQLADLDIPLACDWEKASLDTSIVPYRVIKPVREDVETLVVEESLGSRKVVITSSMDHPIGQLSAAWSAAMLHKLYPHLIELCGLITHHVYEPDAFSEVLTVDNDRLVIPKGTGLGFDDQLSRLQWKKLR